jgi:hypothetical protein
LTRIDPGAFAETCVSLDDVSGNTLQIAGDTFRHRSPALPPTIIPVSTGGNRHMGLIEPIWELVGPIRYAALYMLACWTLLPLGLYIFPRIKSRQKSAWLHIILGVALSLSLFRGDTFLLLLAILVGYWAITIHPVGAGLCAFAMTSASHIAFAIRCGGWAMDVSGNMMCLFQKILATSFNISDGRKKQSGKELRSKRWNDVVLLERPSLLEWFAYCLTPFGSFGNPFIEFRIFDFMLDVGSRPPISEEEYKRAICQYKWSFVHAIFQLFAWSHVNETAYESDLYVNSSVLSKLGLMIFFTHVQLGRYFPSWYCVEAAFIALGLMNNDVIPGEECLNLDYSYAMRSPTCREYLRRWNHTTHLFWKNYLYTRMLDRGWSILLSDAAVKVATAIWHGFRPTFYWMIPEVIFLVNVDRMLIEVFPLEARPPLWKRLLYGTWTLLEMSYVSCTFYYPSTATYFKVRNSFYWIPEFLTVTVFGVCTLRKLKIAKTD